MYRYLLIFTLLLLVSCSGNTDTETEKEILPEVNMEDSLRLAAEHSNKPKVDSAELNKSIKKIEAKYGKQWDFCDCVVKGDSINKAFLKPNLPDKEFDRLSRRFDEIDEKCQAFRIQDANRTPEERAIHEKKVKKCLRAAGIKN